MVRGLASFGSCEPGCVLHHISCVLIAKAFFWDTPGFLLQQGPESQFENRALMTASLASADTGLGRDEASITDSMKSTDSQKKWAYEQWYRAQIIRAYFGKHSAAHIDDQDQEHIYDKDILDTVLNSRRDCAAAVQYRIEHIAESCHFACAPCKGDTFRINCGLLFEGECAGE